MEWAALITWVATAGLGFFMLAIWLSRGGMKQSTGIKPFLILSHFLLRRQGSSSGSPTSRGQRHARLDRLRDPRARRAPRLDDVRGLVPTAPGARGGHRGCRSNQPAEQHFPVSVIALHGVLAVTPVLLVLLTALEV